MTPSPETAALSAGLTRAYGALWGALPDLPSRAGYDDFLRLHERLERALDAAPTAPREVRNARLCAASMRSVLDFVFEFPKRPADDLLSDLWGGDLRARLATWIAEHPAPPAERPSNLVSSNHPEVAALARAALPGLVEAVVAWGRGKGWFPSDAPPPTVEAARAPSRYIPADNTVYLDSDLFYGTAQNGGIRLWVDLAAAALFHEMAGHWAQHAFAPQRQPGAFTGADPALLPALIPVEEGFALQREGSALEFLKETGRPFRPETWAMRRAGLAAQALFASLQWAEATEPPVDGARFLARHLPGGYAFAYRSTRRAGLKEMLYRAGSFHGLMMMEALGDHPFAGFWAAPLYEQAARGEAHAS